MTKSTKSIKTSKLSKETKELLDKPITGEHPFIQVQYYDKRSIIKSHLYLKEMFHIIQAFEMVIMNMLDNYIAHWYKWDSFNQMKEKMEMLTFEFAVDSPIIYNVMMSHINQPDECIPTDYLDEVVLIVFKFTVDKKEHVFHLPVWITNMILYKLLFPFDDDECRNVCEDTIFEDKIESVLNVKHIFDEFIQTWLYDIPLKTDLCKDTDSSITH
jgi:hypothetical protein